MGKELLSRAKGRASLVYLPALILLTGLSSFGLGRLSALPERGENLKIISEVTKGENVRLEQSATVSLSGEAAAGKYVASKSGKKYHFPWCSGAQRISAANKIWFESIEAARAAGYTPAENCKGLK